MIRKFRNDVFNDSFIFWFILLTPTLLFFFTLNSSAANQVSLEWHSNNEPNLAGYKIFCREQSQSYEYSTPSWEGTNTYCTIYDLDETKIYCFVARAFDYEGSESQNSNEVCFEPLNLSNPSPTADAGPDQTVDEGQAVLLNGSNSTDPDNGIESYRWVQIGGPIVKLSDSNTKQPVFTAPDVGPEGAALAFELTVVDHNGNPGKDVCTVNVTWRNEPPQANAGRDQSVGVGEGVTLDGSLSLDIDDGIVSYLWAQSGAPTVILSNARSFRPTFTAPTAGPDGVSLTFNLTVTDAGGLQNTDSCVVNITWQNEPPTAIVTPDYMEAIEGTLVKLNGSASRDPEDHIVSYLWTQVEGDPVSLEDPTSPVTTFTAPKTDSLGKNLKFKLTVKDHGGLQGTDMMSIYVRQADLSNHPPVADFTYVTGRRSVAFNDLSSDHDGTIVSWFWDFGDNHTSTHQHPGHRYRRYGTYTVTLTVTDDDGARISQSKTVTFSNRYNRRKGWRRWR